jgi:hypothetical protein
VIDTHAQEHPARPISTRKDRGISRRSLVLGAPAGLVLAGLGTLPAFAAPSYAAVPKLPYEVSRTDTRITRLGKKAYECIDVVLPGAGGKTDRAKLYVPHVAPPSLKTAAASVWFYHSNGSTNTSLDGAYKYGAEMIVDKGGICICPDFGGPSEWVNQNAIAWQTLWAKYLPAVWKIATSFARGNSGGGSLMIWAYGKKMLPYQRGMYVANGTYDMAALYDEAPDRIGPAYGNSRSVAVATNPASLPQSAWKGTRMKIVASLADPIVPPSVHGLRLADLAKPVATDVRIQMHDEGHVVPGWTQKDMVDTFAAWM